jgi:ribulose-phosphate 3-epimerase
MLNLHDEVARIERGGADYVHLDVMDGVFVPRFGLPPETLLALRAISAIPVEVHLMVTDPEPYIQIFVEAGASMVTFHSEASHHVSRVVRTIRTSGAKVGIALNPGTNLDVLEYVLEDLDQVLLMGINPGVLGDTPAPTTIRKIGQLRARIDSLGCQCAIGVDGGVTFGSSIPMVDAGADVLVCGTSTIFRPDRPVDVLLAALRTHLGGAGVGAPPIQRAPK